MSDTALYERTNTKKQFFKTAGIECYHGYQSFVKGEVTAEQAHDIGVKLAEEIKYCNDIKLRLEKIRKFELHKKLGTKKKEFEIVFLYVPNGNKFFTTYL